MLSRGSAIAEQNHRMTKVRLVRTGDSWPDWIQDAAPWRRVCLVVMLSLCMRTTLGAAASAEELFQAHVYTNAAGHKLLYRLLLPADYNPTNRYPVILYLHGAAARGNDNKEPLNWGPRLLLGQNSAQHPFFLVVPQSPRESGWLQWNWTGSGAPKETPALASAVELIEKDLPKRFGIDPARRYITGVSMGGHAVWAVMVGRPGFFAAAAPVCAGGDARMVTDAAARYPVWAFHSDDDHLVPVAQARELVKAWRAHGGTAKYTEYTGLKHSSWKRAYIDPELLDWLFAQKRN